MEVVQLGRMLSPSAFLTPRRAPVDMHHSSELHANLADFGLLLEFKGDLSCDPVATGEGPAIVIHVITDVEVCYRLLEHYLKSILCYDVDLSFKIDRFRPTTTAKRCRFRVDTLRMRERTRVVGGVRRVRLPQTLFILICIKDWIVQ